MKKNLFFIAAMAFVISACGQEKAQKVQTIQKNDKVLNCDEILLELNDAEFYKKQAEEKKALGIKSIVMPLGYVETYMSADEAIAAAESRVQYLNNIYDIRKCDGQKSDGKITDSLESQLQQQMGTGGGYQQMPQNNYPQQQMQQPQGQYNQQGGYIYQPNQQRPY